MSRDGASGSLVVLWGIALFTGIVAGLVLTNLYGLGCRGSACWAESLYSFALFTTLGTGVALSVLVVLSASTSLGKRLLRAALIVVLTLAIAAILFVGGFLFFPPVI